MSYQTILKRLISFNETNTFLTYNEHYNMQIAQLQELQDKLKIYQKREEISKQIVGPMFINHEPDSFIPLKKSSLVFQSFDQVRNALKTSNNLEHTKSECLEMLYQQAFTLNKLAVHSNNIEEKAIYKQEIEKILSMIEKVKNYITPQNTSPKSITKPQNQLVFLEQSNHRITILEELQKEIPLVLYPEFLILFNSLENGSLKGYKNLTAKSFDQVSTKFSRIYFSKLNANHFLILSAMQKNFYTQKHYKEKLNRLERIVKNESESYLAQINHNTFMENQRNIKKQIYTLLRKKEE